jgi:hypothetical protein
VCDGGPGNYVGWANDAMDRSSTVLLGHQPQYGVVANFNLNRRKAVDRSSRVVMRMWSFA